MKNLLFTLLLLLSSLYSYADASSYLKEDIGAFPSYGINSFIEVSSVMRGRVIMSPSIFREESSSDNDNNVNIIVNGINEEGLIQIAKLNNIKRKENYSFPLVLFYDTDLASYSSLCAIYLTERLNEIKSENEVEIDIDFDYLFNVDNKLVNERGEIIFDLGENYRLESYCRKLFYIVCSYYDGASTTKKVYSLVKILSDYATGIKQTSAKAELQSSKTYDITGVEVDEDAKGIIIQDGKKFMK